MKPQGGFPGVLLIATGHFDPWPPIQTQIQVLQMLKASDAQSDDARWGRLKVNRCEPLCASAKSGTALRIIRRFSAYSVRSGWLDTREGAFTLQIRDVSIDRFAYECADAARLIVTMSRGRHVQSASGCAKCR